MTVCFFSFFLDMDKSITYQKLRHILLNMDMVTIKLFSFYIIVCSLILASCYVKKTIEINNKTVQVKEIEKESDTQSPEGTTEKTAYDVMQILDKEILQPNLSAEVFKNAFLKNTPTYEFDIRNPLAICKLDGYDYLHIVSDIDSVKSKIIRTYRIRYSIDKGIKHYGDGEPEESYEYTVFDETGCINKKYYFIVDKDKSLKFRHICDFLCDGKTYTVSNFGDGYNNQFKTTETFFITQNPNGSVDLDNNERSLYHFENGNITFNFINKVDMYKRTDGKIIYNSISRTKEEFNEGTIFCNGIIMENLRSANDKCINHSVYSTENGEGEILHYSINDENIREDYPSSYLKRILNQAGYLEYEEIRPLINGADGEYSCIKTELLSEPDELFLRYIGKYE